MNHASVVVEMLLLQVPYNVPIIPTFGSARRVAPPPAGTAGNQGRRRMPSPINRLEVIAQFSCKILPFFPRALRRAAARP
jgi:hypothetical protein